MVNIPKPRQFKVVFMNILKSINHEVIFFKIDIRFTMLRLAQTTKTTRCAIVFAHMTYDVTSFKMAQKMQAFGEKKSKEITLETTGRPRL